MSIVSQALANDSHLGFASVAKSKVPTSDSIGITASNSKPASAAATSNAAGNTVITSSDFITLLVTELKNQDPTSNQDPNAYINQLVSVNSLQQLISINQDLTPSSPTTGSGAVTASSGLQTNEASSTSAVA